MELTDKQLHDLRQMVTTQGSNGNWNYDPYMQGMYNGMELMLAIIEDREPDFKKAPDEWLHDKPTSENLASSELAPTPTKGTADTTELAHDKSDVRKEANSKEGSPERE